MKDFSAMIKQADINGKVSALLNVMDEKKIAAKDLEVVLPHFLASILNRLDNQKSIEVARMNMEGIKGAVLHILSNNGFE